MTESQLPAHKHSFTPSGTVNSSFSGTAVNTDTKGSHSHTTNITTDLTGYFSISDTCYFHTDTSVSGKFSLYGKSTGRKTVRSSTETYNCGYMKLDVNHLHTTDSQGSHQHSVTASGTVTSSFVGSVGATGSTGSGSSINILPPYVVKYCWERTA